MYGGTAGYYEYINYCPNCGHYDCLLVNPKGTYEGELSCSICDSDYDGTTGADKHANGAWSWLTPYTPEPIKKDINRTEPKKEESKLDIYKKIIQTKQDNIIMN